MSRLLCLKDLTDKQLAKLGKDLCISVLPSKYSFQTQPNIIQLYDVEGSNLYIPFAYASSGSDSGSKSSSDSKSSYPRPLRSAFPETKAVFEGVLREEQKVVKSEAIERLNKDGSIIISAACGFGKCFRYNTPVLMYNGTVCKAQDIQTGDVLMGDDSTARTVLSTNIGRETMYNIVPLDGYPPFGVNASHILCLQRMDDNGTMHRETMEEMTVLEVLKMQMENPAKRAQLRLYRSPVFFSEQKIHYDPYIIGLYIGLPADTLLRTPFLDIAMYAKNQDLTIRKAHSIYLIRAPHYPRYDKLPLEYKANSLDVRRRVLAGAIDQCGYVCRKKCVIFPSSVQLADDLVYIARSLGMYARIYGTRIVMLKGSTQLRRLPLLTPSFKFDPDYQEHLRTEFTVVPIPDDNCFYGFTLDGNRRFLLGDFTVTHNTAMSIYIATKIRLRTLILCHRVVLINQWKEAIQRFCPNATVQVLNTGQTELASDTDFFLVNAVNVPKYSRAFYKQIGCVIVDECHIIMADKMSRCMRYLLPRYVIGLSATPYRTDGLNALLDMYFGTQKIVRELHRKHHVYTVHTGFEPTIELNRMGKIDWGVVLNSQADDVKRNEMIINLILQHPDRVFLVLCKRLSQGRYLVQRLQEEKQDVTSLLGKQQEYEQKSRILVGSVGKCSVGFDHPRLNTMILAADVEQYFVQYLGRVFRTQDTVPVIFDLVDDHSLMKKHYATRHQIYMDHGGIVRVWEGSMEKTEQGADEQGKPKPKPKGKGKAKKAVNTKQEPEPDQDLVPMLPD